MEISEKFNEVFFDERDRRLISEIKKKDKRNIIILILVLVSAILIIPVSPGRNGKILINEMTYSNAILLGAVIFFVLFGLPMLFFMTRKFNDYKNDKKIVLETKIKKIRHDKEDIKLALTSPYLKSKWIFVHRDKYYPNLAINDSIMISYLPRTRFVLELKKL